MMAAHYKTICQHGYVHSQCRCIGPKEVKTIVCNVMSHAKNPKVTEPVEKVTLHSVPSDVEEYFSGVVGEDAMTKEVWETLSAALHALDNAYGDNEKIDAARDWLTGQFGVWES